ncbi:hypothetical protein A4A49_56079, partial [Nicotiana attenuata]
MPRMEVIRKSFIAQTELRGGVKIAHFNARTVYIDLDNEYDHSTVWGKQFMYIQGQMMKLEAWSPAFKPNEDSPIVPIWVVIPELPWHLYYMEILNPLLSPIGKALYLDLASFQKTRGSVAKVKIQIDLTKERPHHVWLGYDDNQDENGDGEWLEVQYDNIPAYCTHCKHLGHSEYLCEIRIKEEEKKQRKEEEVKQAKSKKGGHHQNEPPKATGSQQDIEHQNTGTDGEWQTQKKKSFKGTGQNKKYQQVHMPKPSSISQEIPRTRQEGAPNGGGLPHVLHECVNTQLTDSRMAHIPSATTPQSTDIVQQQLSTKEGNVEILSSEDEPPDQHNDELRKLIKGKAHAAADFTIQSPKSKTKLSQKKRQARKRNSGISISEPSATPIPGHVATKEKDHTYKDSDADPSLSQPLLQKNSHNPKLKEVPSVLINQDPANVLVAAPFEECPLNKFSPEIDEYRPLLSEDDMSGGLEGDNELSETSDEDQHCAMLIEAVNGTTDQDESRLSQRSIMRPSPRYTRSRAAANSKLRHVEAAETFHISVIYAKCKPILRRPLWENLRLKSTTTHVPWCVIGDFNVIASIEEKIGGLPYQIHKSIDFLSMIEDCGLIDMGFYGPKYTWSNGRGPCAIVWKRLDRGMINDSWLTSFPATTITHLASSGSDHSPLLMEMHVRPKSSKKYFRFLNCWTDNPTFMPLVQAVWNTQIYGNPMWVFHQKAKILSSELSKWSRQEYGDIFQEAKDYEAKVKAAEELWAQTNSPTDREALHNLNAQY